MARTALIGALRVNLGLNSAEFEKGADRSIRKMRDVERAGEGLGKSLRNMAGASAEFASSFVLGSTKAQQALGELAAKVTNLGQAIANTGKTMTKGVTLPVVGVGAAVIKVAADFESAMNRIQIATEASAAEMEQMRKIALEIGNDTVFGASEAASAMESLAKAGLSTTTIINGAAKAATNLAAAAGSDLDPAASAIADSIGQFNLAAEDLPTIVNQITGAVNESKFEFADFTGGMAQAGGVAAAAGVSFEDFAATLAATSSQFNSGSDAGTSFKTFLLSLTPQTKKAAALFKEFNLEFYEANGQMKSLAAIAEILRDRFAGLSEEQRTATLKELFGTDAIRTAVGLMNQGADGIERITKALAETSAADQAAKRMRGLAGQIEQLKGALETLAIAIANTGLLEAVTGIVKSMADFVSRLSEAHPRLLKAAVSVGVFAAALGPLLVVLGTLASTALPFLLVRLGAIPLALSAIISPLGTAIALFGRFALSLIASTGAIGAAFSALAGVAAPLLVPLAAIAAVGVVIYTNWDRIAPVLEEFWAQAQQSLGPPLRELITTLSRVFSDLWDGPLGEGIRGAIALSVEFAEVAQRAFGTALIETIKAALGAILALLDQLGRGIRFVNAILKGDWKTAWQQAAGSAGSFLGFIKDKILDLLGPIGLVIRGLEKIRGLAPKPQAVPAPSPQGPSKGAVDKVLAAMITPRRSAGAAPGGVNLGGEESGSSGGRSRPAGKSAADIAREAAQKAARFDDQLGQLKIDQLHAEQEYTGNIMQRRDVALAALDEELASFERNLALDEDKTDAQKQELLEKQRALIAQRKWNEEQQYGIDLANQENELSQAALRLEIDDLALQRDMADNSRDRLAAELAIFDRTEKLRDAQLDLILATEATASAAWQNAKDEKEWLNANRGARRALVERQNQTPGQRFVESLNLKGGALRDAMDEIKINGLNALNDGLVDAIVNFRSLGQVAQSVIKQILSDLLTLQIRQSIIGPLASALGLGASAFGGGGGFSFSKGIGSIASGNFGFAKGTNFAPRGFALVGERGPEIVRFRGGEQVIPNDKIGRMGGDTYNLNIAVNGAMDDRAARRTGSQLANQFRREVGKTARTGVA